MDKKMYKYIGILLGLILLLVIFIWLTNVFTGGNKLSYESLEKKLIDAAKDYAKDYSAIYPTEIGTSTVISSTVLINNNYINEFSSYLNDTDVVCNGSVEIYMVEEDYYNFTTDFNCGNKYSNIKLYEKIIADNNYGIVEGSGLYEKVDGKFITDESELGSHDYNTLEYVFRGDEVNNFLKIDENLWRIVSINENGDILLIYVGHVQKTSPWDDRYNETVKKNQGINIYEKDGIKSRAMENALKFYNGEVVLMDKEPYSEKTRYLTVPMSLCVGKRNQTDSDISGSIECQTILENQYVGLLPAYYYMSASLDDSCNSIVSKNCGNYNYLSYFDDYWWLLTANSENTNEAYNISRKFAESTLCSSRSNIRPIIMLGSRAIYDSGDGTENNPYIVKYF